MAITAASLADGQVPGAQTALYTAPALTKAYVRTVKFYNTGGVTVTVTACVKRSGGTARIMAAISLATLESADLVDPDESWVLSAGDAIEAVSTTSAVVDYTILGAEEA